jgi:hypothetical protein
MNEAWAREWNMGRDVAIDETIVGHKGNHALKIYIRIKKHHQWGAKEYNIADSRTNYIYRTMYHVNNREKSTFGQPYDVCEKLFTEAGLFNKRHHLIVDNYYTSVPLVERFLARGTYVTGTVQGNRRGLPDEVKQGPHQKDSLVQCSKGGILATYWHDRAKVRFLSTFSASGRTEKTDKRGQVRLIPTVAAIYNENMGGVDQADQMVDCFAGELRTVKLWRKVGFHLVDRCLNNAYVLYKNNPNVRRPIMTHHQFLVNIVEDLVAQYQEPRARRGKKRVNPPARLVERHFHSKMSDGRRADCHLCSRRTREEASRSRTRYWCADCQEPLCIDNCLERYHTVL